MLQCKDFTRGHLRTFSKSETAPLKAGFHWRRSRIRSRNQKRRAYDLVKTTFRLRLRLRRLRSAYNLVKTRLSESEAEAEEPNQKQSVGTCIVIGLSFRFCFRLRQFSLHHKRKVSDGVVSGVGRKWKRSESSDSDSVALMTPLTTPIFDFH